MQCKVTGCFKDSHESGRCRRHTTLHKSSLKCRAARVAYVNAIKVAKGCAVCGNRYAADFLDFDHIPAKGRKLANVSDLVNSCRVFEVIDAEIKKCEVVCVACHRKRTRDRQH